MTPRILNLQARTAPPHATEPCAPDVHYFPLNEESIIAFDANTLVAVEISAAQYKELTREREAPADAPRSALNAQHSEAPPHALLFSRHRPKFDLSPDVSCRQLTLHLSDQCNQRCRYCWVGKAEAETRRRGNAEKRKKSGAPVPASAVPAVMTREVAAAALGMFPADGRDLRIGFFGGEPLLHFGTLMLITEMAERLAERNKTHMLFHVTTNATLVTPIVARFLAEHGFSIIVSCDGLEDLHDAARGEGSHAATVRGLNLLHRAGCSGRVTLRGTWSGFPAEVLARLGALNKLSEDGLAAGVALEPVAGASYGHTLDAEVHSACNWFGAHARSGGTPRWQYLEKTLQRILWQQFRSSECGAGRGYYAIGPTGTIYACHKQQSGEIGSVNRRDGVNLTWQIDENLRAKWLDNRFCARSECGRCWARHVCGGACRSESLEFCGGIGGQGDIAQPHAGRCMLMRELVAEALRLAATLPRETLIRICPATDARSRCT